MNIWKYRRIYTPAHYWTPHFSSLMQPMHYPKILSKKSLLSPVWVEYHRFQPTATSVTNSSSPGEQRNTAQGTHSCFPRSLAHAKLLLHITTHMLFTISSNLTAVVALVSRSSWTRIAVTETWLPVMRQMLPATTAALASTASSLQPCCLFTSAPAVTDACFLVP